MFYITSICLSGWGIVVSYVAPQTQTYIKICLLGWALNNDHLYNQVLHSFCMGSGIVSVLLFFVIWFVVRRNDRRVTGKTTTAKAMSDKLQRRMTTSICASSIFTLFLVYCIVSVVQTYNSGGNPNICAQLHDKYRVHVPIRPRSLGVQQSKPNRKLLHIYDTSQRVACGNQIFIDGKAYGRASFAINVARCIRLSHKF